MESDGYSSSWGYREVWKGASTALNPILKVIHSVLGTEKGVRRIPLRVSLSDFRQKVAEERK